MKKGLVSIMVGLLFFGINSSAIAEYVADDVVCTECVNDADIASGTITASKVGYYNNVIIVAPNGKGHFADPASAVASITDASASNPYLVKLMPGIYDIGPGSVLMKPYVDLEGSGRNVTKITGNKECIYEPSGVIFGASNSEIRNLTVEHQGGVSYAVAVYNMATNDTKITSVKVIASGGYTYTTGITNSATTSIAITDTTIEANGVGVVTAGIYNDASSINSSISNVKSTASGGGEARAISIEWESTTDMESVTATAVGGGTCFGIYNNSLNLTAKRITADASGGSKNYGIYNEDYNNAIVKLDNSVLKGSTSALYNGSGMTNYVGYSKFEGGRVSNHGSLICIGAYNGTYGRLNSVCQ